MGRMLQCLDLNPEQPGPRVHTLNHPARMKVNMQKIARIQGANAECLSLGGSFFPECLAPINPGV